MDTIVEVHKHVPIKKPKAKALPPLPQYDANKVGRDEVLNVDVLNVDHTYQRPVDHRHAMDIAINFNPKKLFRLAINRRPDGTYWILDGQQRAEAIKLLGGNYPVDCVVYDLATVAEEAAFFAHFNWDRKNTNAMDRWKARLAQGDPDAQRIQSEIDQARLKLAHAGQGLRTIRAIGTVHDWTDKDVETLSVVIMVLGKYTYIEPLDGVVVAGLCYAEHYLRQHSSSLTRARTARETYANFLINKGYTFLREASMRYQGLRKGLGGGQAGRAKVAAKGIIELVNYNMKANRLPEIN